MFRRKLVVLSGVSFIMLISLVGASVIYTGKLNSYNRFFLTEVEPRSNALNAMLTSFGYGHAIHNFKNLVIRGRNEINREKYTKRLLFNKHQFYHAMYNYVALVNQNTLAEHHFADSGQQLVNDERASLKKIKIVFDLYMDEVDLVAALYQQVDDNGLPYTVDRLDQKIKINDEPAVTGMKMLQTGIIQLRSEVLNSSHQLATTLNILIIMSAVILAVFICTAIAFAFQLLRPIIHLGQKIKEVQCTSKAINQFHYPHDDEIGYLFDLIKRHARPGEDEKDVESLELLQP